MGALTPLAVSIAPEIARWLFGADAEKAEATITNAVQSVTGTADLDAAMAFLQMNPAAAAQLRLQLLQLLQLGTELDETSRATTLVDLKSAVAGGVDASSKAFGDPPQPAILAWSPPLISAAVLISFGSVVMLVLVKGVPSGNETTANMLLGTLAAMATSVVSYWVGSSAGSARKDARLTQAAK